MDKFTLTSLQEQAKAAMERNQFATAVELCQRILKASRNDGRALMLLAQMSFARGGHGDAEKYMSRVIKAHPRNPQHRVFLARVYLRRGRPGAALVQLEKALKLQPDYMPAIVTKANVYEFQDKYDRAKKALAPLLRLERVPPEAAAPQMRFLIREKAYDEAIELGARVVDSSPPESMALRNVLIELARARERSGDCAQAFATAERANEILAVAFDPDQNDALIDRYIATFSAERLGALPRATVPSAQAVFIVGFPRTGSTLVERIIASHPKAHGVGEHSAMHRLARALRGEIGSMHAYPECVADLTTDHADVAARTYLDEVSATAPQAERIVNKELSNYLNLGLISAILPQARIIHCRRDPMDTGLSCFMERLHPMSVPYASNLRSIGRAYRAYQRLMTHWARVLDLPVLEVEYETLVDDQDAGSRRIIDFLGLPWDDACLEFHKAKRQEQTLSYDQVRQPIYRSAIGRAAAFGALLDPLRETLGDALPPPAADPGGTAPRPDRP